MVGETHTSEKNIYEATKIKLGEVLSEENLRKLSPYIHVYDGSEKSVKPVAKTITIYYIARAADRLTIRTEGEDDIILSTIGDSAVPTIIFRKMKAIYLREFMKLARLQWERLSENIRKVWYGDIDFITKCSLTVGIAGAETGKGKGAMHGRCMKCPVDVLMGATSATVNYNLVSRFVGDSAYALTSSYERLTGNAVDEITYTTIMLTSARQTEEERRTGGLYYMTFVPPGTLFVGKFVLFMPSPPELLYSLWLLTKTVRVGARTSIQGTLEVYPVAIIGDLNECGSAYEASEKAFGLREIEKVRGKLLEYIGSKLCSTSSFIEITQDILSKLQKLDILDNKLVSELWLNAKNYIDGVTKYIGVSPTKSATEAGEERVKSKK
jgi:CRISPR type I-D-associated protein Csc2